MNNIKAQAQNTRFEIVDFFRGIAVLLMIFFHFSYDLNLFKYIHINILEDDFWFFLPRIIVFIFMFCAGMSLYIAYPKEIHWKKFGLRQSKLLFFAIIISLVTYFLFPENWIYFGTLHAIFLCSFLAIPFLKTPKLNFALFLILFVPTWAGDWTWPWIKMNHPSMDYIEPFPWLGAMLLGISMGHFQLQRFKIPSFRIFKYISWAGKHSLWIYLIHQPILFGCLLIYSKIF